MKRWLVVMLVVILGASFTLIKVPEMVAQDVAPTRSPAAKMPERLIWSCDKPGQAPYEQSLAVTKLVSRQLTVTLHPYPNLDAALIGISKKKVDLCLPTASLVYHMARGITSDLQQIGIEEPCRELRLLMGGSVLWWSWITLPDSNIKTIADLKGKKVNYMTPGHGLKTAIGEDTLRAVGIDPVKDVKNISYDDTNVAKEGLQHKKIDALLSALAGAKLLELRSMVGLEVIPTPPEIYKAFRPGLKRVMISSEVPGKYLTVIDKPTFLLGHQLLLVCREDLHEEAAYLIVKTIMENARELHKIGPVFKEWGVKQFALPLQLVAPVHSGAMKYFKEAGMWTPAHEAQQQEVVAELAKLSK